MFQHNSDSKLMRWRMQAPSPQLVAMALALASAGCAQPFVPAVLPPEVVPAKPAQVATVAPRIEPLAPVVAPPQPPPPAQPKVEIVKLGRSVKGTEINMLVVGDAGPAVLVFGGIHGNEPTSATVAAELAEVLRKEPQLAGGGRVAVITQLNPDGVEASKRTNANGVDLNRNFPARNWALGTKGPSYSGDKPASEPETRALIQAVQTLKPVCIVALHSIARGRHCNNYDGPAQPIAKAMNRCNGYPVQASIGYPTPGSFGSWAGVDQNIATITLELPRDLDAASCWRENRQALLEAIKLNGAQADADGSRHGS